MSKVTDTFRGRWAFAGEGDLLIGDVRRLSSAGFHGVILAIEWQADDGQDDRTRKSLAALREDVRQVRAAGMRVAIWAWLESGPPCAANLDERLAEISSLWTPEEGGPPDFVCLNLEFGGDWDEGRPAAQAEQLAAVQAVLDARLPGCPLAVTSHGFAPRFSWNRLRVDAVMPQCYDPAGGPAKRGFIGRCLATYAREFPQALAFPVLGVNSTAASRMAKLGAEAVTSGAPAFAYWSAIGLRALDKLGTAAKINPAPPPKSAEQDGAVC